MGEWLSLDDIAKMASIRTQGIRKAILRANHSSMCLWRGSEITYRKVKSAHGGGNSGLSYQVLKSSLPVALQLTSNTVLQPVEERLNHGSKATWEWKFWDRVLAPITGLPPRSPLRVSRIKEIASREYPSPEGEILRYSERTVRRWLDRIEKHGLAGLGRRKRRDVGRKAVIVTRDFDDAARAAGISDDELAKVKTKIKAHIQSYIAQGAQRVVIRPTVALKLNQIANRLGIGNPNKPYTIPEHLIQREKIYRQVAIHGRDQKRYVDNQPRVHRTIEGMFPMQLVVGDVHPIDIQYPRADGSLATPRLIGWYDVATKRFFGTVVFCNAGRSITNADAIQSFLDMVAAWGVPQNLYLDNGSEYNFADYIEPGLRLLREYGSETGNARLSIIRALPRNASAKPIEGIFAIIEKYLRDISGHIGGDRMRKKVSNIHRSVDIYRGTLESFVANIQSRSALYNASGQHGELDGKSPNDAYQLAIDKGWCMTGADPLAFQLAFSKEEVRTVTQHEISINGQKWTCDELRMYPGKKVTAMVPVYLNFSRIPLKRENENEVFAYAMPVQKYHYLDPAGAKESGRIKQLAVHGIRDLRNTLRPQIDIQSDIDNIIRLRPPPTAPIGAMLHASDEAKRITDNMTEPQHDRKMREFYEQSDESTRKLKRLQKSMQKTSEAS